MNPNKCIVCKDRNVNPSIGEGKSFCSRICEYLYWDVTLSTASPELLKRMADYTHAAVADDRKYS